MPYLDPTKTKEGEQLDYKGNDFDFKFDKRVATDENDASIVGAIEKLLKLVPTPADAAAAARDLAGPPPVAAAETGGPTAKALRPRSTVAKAGACRWHVSCDDRLKNARSHAMRILTNSLLALLLLLSVTSSRAAGLESIGTEESSAGLRRALSQGATAAVAQLGRADGFLGNPKVKIPLPENLQKAERLMRRLRMGRYADELITTMNRAAEAAVPEAKELLLDAVKRMTLGDATAILTGGDDAATQYFRRTTSETLTARFLPIVRQATERVELARTYDRYAKQAAKFGLVGERDASLDHYVTQKALDGLFFMIAEEERAIRRNPLGQADSLLRKVFGSLR